MFCDHRTAHVDNLQLTNIKLIYLPANIIISIIQPIDQGIIANLKKTLQVTSSQSCRIYHR